MTRNLSAKLLGDANDVSSSRAALKHHFHELYFVPEMAELADVNAVLNNYISEPNRSAGKPPYALSFPMSIISIRIISLHKLANTLCMVQEINIKSSVDK